MNHTKNEKLLSLDKNYNAFLMNMKDHLKTAQIKAALASNRELIMFYWQVGKKLVEKQNFYNCEEKLFEQFSHDMRRAFPEMRGFSVSNLKSMRLFALSYSEYEIGPQFVDQLPWGHIAVLLHQIKDKETRLWYTKEVIKHGWSRSVLEMQIESGLYERQSISDNNNTNYQSKHDN